MDAKQSAYEAEVKRHQSVGDALMQAIPEHREGTPEGVPYQPAEDRPR
jgi:hypothetical protein